jgi:hypothetical protein
MSMDLWQVDLSTTLCGDDAYLDRTSSRLYRAAAVPTKLFLFPTSIPFVSFFQQAGLAFKVNADRLAVLVPVPFPSIYNGSSGHNPIKRLG